ncbi:hypothetical protein OFN33_20600 [Escherichia coli]|nr:hypothetical protein [Escherichia coli]
MKRYTHDLETDLNDVDKTPSLIHKTLLTASTIYDLKYLAQVLNDENGSNWSRASLKRQVTCIPEPETPATTPARSVLSCREVHHSAPWMP